MNSIKIYGPAQLLLILKIISQFKLIFAENATTSHLGAGADQTGTETLQQTNGSYNGTAPEFEYEITGILGT